MNLREFTSAEFTKFVQDHLEEDPALLLFKYQGKVPFDLKIAVQQIAARQKAAKKLPTWSKNLKLLFPASISVEQSSSEQTASFKALDRSGRSMVDLTGGLGIDCHYLSQGFEKGVYCEQQAELFQISQHNLTTLNPGKFDFLEGDGLEFLQKTTQHFDLIYADPARRGTGNQKLYRLQDCEPNVVDTWSLLQNKSNSILLKASPMLDLTQAWAELPDLQKITVVSVRNEVKELLLHWEKANEGTPRMISVVDLESGFSPFEFEPGAEERAHSQFAEAGNYLIEPLAGILKAGAFTLFGARFGLKKLERNSHLYTSDSFTRDIPGRIFEVIQEISPKKQVLKTIFPTGKVNVICRNYVMGPEELKKKLGLKDGGEDYLIGTQTATGFKLYGCKRIQ
ncbi:MAG: class I SAM-dependent methyltransferase [Algoriphagus sp.]|jgi:16S rRNA G966 N2-methylase RsmD|uniref:THUMP-like domain-containing protein n=1 Tax=Algoriphagus sp. TaxID=1872435 RepID=UPI0027656BFF|nr:class I SAM-dependent methyltransferase [Algoriphagus sp.]MDP4748811.1 class I SAM-dependent methyltransferase [Algoriphagus sp.]MDP4839734.1 class I SAM-dependent methyltransferase [Algoriphagus sp.]MDP4905310.1 class I SAM-dependent methyltransferase [Algoriphagus sp.]MDP4957819.1 class I SAM-dependent methyltransferase [Algoriphagus sp.]